MSYTYQMYCAQMRGLRKTPMSQKQFNEMQCINSEPIIPPLQIRPKNQRPVKPTMENHVIHG